MNNNETTEAIRLAVKNERARVVQILLAFQSAALNESAPTEVVALWSFAVQFLLEVDGRGNHDDVARRYVNALQDLGIDATKIATIEAMLFAMLSMVGSRLEWGAVSVSGDGASETTIRNATKSEFDSVVPSELCSDHTKTKFN